ncbi:MAG: phosphotransferase [Clostridiales bacterium]|nr:phosphotransferase [Clostridiales bacterium]
MRPATFDIKEICAAFKFDGDYIGFYSIDNGHINSTYVVEFETELEQINYYLLQEININVFRKPDELMQNIENVTAYLTKQIEKEGGDVNRETLHVYRTKDDKPYYVDKNGKYWRVYNFITNSYTCQIIEDPLVLFNAAKAFGRFQCMLADYPSETLFETIPNFHNTAVRFGDLKQAVETDAVGRASSVQKEIEFAFKREKDAHVLVDLLEKNKLPLRVTHNDTKLNNVMFDKDTNEGICVVDLDTVMPGLSLYDFGDSIRFGANTAEEDERDLSKVSLSLSLYEQYTRGYLSTAGKSLTELEIKYLPFSAKLMTYECGMRFLTDYLNGDTYFHTDYDDHNLVRCRTQFKLVEDIEKKLDTMSEITYACIK